jgi:hypothetical protein
VPLGRCLGPREVKSSSGLKDHYIDDVAPRFTCSAALLFAAWPAVLSALKSTEELFPDALYEPAGGQAQ